MHSSDRTAAFLTSFVFGLSLVSVILVCSCGSGDRPLETVDPDAVPADPSFDSVFAIIQRECTPCHQGDGEDDSLDDYYVGGNALANAEPGLATCKDILDAAGDIGNTVLEKNTMPPGAWPRLTSEQKLIIKRWLTNGAKAPCQGQ